jgi:hypothetical protein
VGGVATVTIPGGSNATPGGSNTQIQFNDGGTFGGDGYFTYNKTSRLLSLVGNANISYKTTTTDLTVTGVSNLNAVGNVIITGGSNGQVLTTNGSGNLSWTTVSSGGGDTVYNKGNVSGNTTINYSDGTIQTCTMIGNTNFNITSVTSSKSVTILITQGGSGNYFATFGNSTVKWAVAYNTLSSTVGAVDMINMVNIGNVYYATLTVGYV